MTNIKAIIGANYGDEGKGNLTSAFAHTIQYYNKSCLVVCSNGGAQRGHTVISGNGIKHVFRHFGSGTFAGADTFLSRNFILNPMIFVEELSELKRLMNTDFKVWADKRCRVTTPFDMIINMVTEDARGDERHGSVGVGIWETINRCGYSINQLSSMTYQELTRYLVDIRDIFLPQRIQSLGIQIPESWREVIYSNDLITHYISDLQYMISIIQLTDSTVIKSYDEILFENGQGLMLSDSFLPYDSKYLTPSHTGLLEVWNVIKDSGISPDDLSFESIYITRSYMTRHGNGPMMDCIPYSSDMTKAPSFINIDNEINVPNKYQGTLRYAKIKPVELINRIILCEEQFPEFEKFRKSSKMTGTSLAITHMDEYNCRDDWSSILGSMHGNNYEDHFDMIYESYGPNGPYQETSVTSYFR